MGDNNVSIADADFMDFYKIQLLSCVHTFYTFSHQSITPVDSYWAPFLLNRKNPTRGKQLKEGQKGFRSTCASHEAIRGTSSALKQSAISVLM